MIVVTSVGAQISLAQVVNRQQIRPIGNTPTAADMYCSGFITAEHVPSDHYVAGGWNSPNQTRFASLVDYIYIHGRDLKVGDRYQIVRHAKDPDLHEPYPGARSAIKNAGEPYFELGYAKVIDVQKNLAVAVPELACADFVDGDIAIPFVERTPPVFRDVALDRFAPPSGQPVGRIIMGKEFDSMLGTKYIAYINLGEDKVRVGDYLRATRTYSYGFHDPVMGMSRYATAHEDTQADEHPLAEGQISTLPRRTLGDMIVLQTHKHSSTVMIMAALEDIYVGDAVEVMDVSSAPELQPLRPVAAAKATANPAGTSVPLNLEPDTATAIPPQISCTASPSNVRVGESSTIVCQTSSRDNRPVSVTFVSNGGKLSSSRNQATLDTSESGPGLVEVRATAYDDRQLSASSTTRVSVEPLAVAATPTAQKMTQLDFKPNSAYVDNRSKAILDDVALKLQHEPTSSAVLFGASGDGEPSRLAAQRAENAKTYLTSSKGIDPQRIQAKSGGPAGRTVDVWAVPSGATAPTEDK
jgi:outer membrane protein OmpA-like peptidoglycan-associated protein